VSLSEGLVLGIDAGGTKVHAMVRRVGGDIVDQHIVEGAGWNSASFAERADLVSTLAQRWPGVSAIGLGAHGCDSDADCLRLQGEITARVTLPVRVVNDAVLFGYAMGAPHAVNVVLGTGSIVVTRPGQSPASYWGGWGWLVGDDGSAWGIVRTAVRALTLAPDHDNDPLTALLRERTGMGDLRQIVDLMQRSEPSVWASWAECVFLAQTRGSASAKVALKAGVRHTRTLIEQAVLHHPGASAVVLGGGVVQHQAEYAARLREAVRDCVSIEVATLTRAPVLGAVHLAEEAAGVLPQ